MITTSLSNYKKFNFENLSFFSNENLIQNQ